jgi:RNA polymerase sigma-70 factor (ECF subfamily)
MRLPWQSPDDHHRALLARAQAGDREAFRTLYVDLYDPVARFVARRVRRREDAEDLVGKVFHQFLEHLGDIDPQRGSTRMFVLSMARNAVIDFARVRRNNLPLEDVAALLEDGGHGPLETMIHEERVAALRSAISEMASESRELLLLRHGDGLKHAEIAELMGETTDTIKQRLWRAHRALRERLDTHAAAETSSGKGEVTRVRPG